MLYDRDYMRSDGGGYWRSPVVLLLIALVALFFVECVSIVYLRHSLAQEFGLTFSAIREHQYWRLLTYQFLHVAPWPFHLLFNAIGLWFLGRAICETLGHARFWQIYLLSGVLGGLVEVGCQALGPQFRDVPVIGASGAVSGLLGAFCLSFPTQELTTFVYFIPVRVRSMTLFWIWLCFSLFGIVFPFGGLAHGAHLGGLVTGAVFVRYFLQEENRAWLRRFTPRRAARREDVPVTAAKAAGKVGRSSIPAAEVESPEDFIRREVDPILDKISAHGIQSLTERERRILEKARERMRRR